MADDNAVTVKFGASIDGLIAGVDDAKASIQSLAGPVDEISSICTELGGLLAAAFSLDSIKSFVASMEQLGVQTERSSQMLGMTVEQVSKLNAIGEMTGGSADALTRGMERLAFTMEHAAAGGKMQQDAFRQLGVSYKDASGNLLPLDVMLGKVADRFAAAPNGPQKTALAIEIFSRVGAEMIPMLNQGSAGLKAYGDEAEKTGVVLSNQTVAGMTLAYRSGLSLTESLKGLGIEMFSQLAPALTEATNNLTSFVQGMTKAISESKLFAVAIDFLSNKMWNYIEAAASAVTGISAETVGMNILADAMQKAGKQLAGLSQEWTDFDAKMTGTAAKKTPFNAPTDPTAQGTGQKAAETQYQTMIEVADASYAQLKQQYAADVAAHRMSVDEETKDLLAALDFRHTAEDATYTAALQAAQGDAAKYADVQKQKTAADEKFKLQHSQITDQAVKEDAKAWESLMQPIESSFNSQLRGLLAGTETWGQAMKKIVGDLVIAFIEGIEKIAVTWIAEQLAMAVGAPASLLAGATKAISANVGVVYSGEAANMALALGPAAPAAAAGIAAQVEATALGLSALDVGGYVNTTGMAIVHQGEAVVPASVATPYQGGGQGGGGGNTIHFNISAIDGASVQRFFQQHAGQINRVLQNNTSLNPSLG